MQKDKQETKGQSLNIFAHIFQVLRKGPGLNSFSSKVVLEPILIQKNMVITPLEVINCVFPVCRVWLHKA